MPRRDGTRGSGAHIRQIAVIHQQRLDQPGSSREQDHQSVETGKPDLRIVEETGTDLDRKAVEAWDVGSLDVHLAVGVVDLHRQDRRHHDVTRRKRHKHTFDHVHCGEVQWHSGAQINLGQNPHLMAHKASLSRYSLPDARLGRP